MIQEFFTARDGKQLAYRWFAAPDSEHVVICLHGSTFNGLRYANFARVIAMRGTNVCLPDWRGHGESEGLPGDLDYETQLQDDLFDLIEHLTSKGICKVVLGGHSAGALIALRFIATTEHPQVSGYFAIAPPLTSTDETRKYDFTKGNWEYRIRYCRKKSHYRQPDKRALQYAPEINIAKYTLAHVIPWFRSLKVMNFPEAGGTQGRVLSYSYRLLDAYSVRNYPELFSSLKVPCHFIVGEYDEVIDNDTLSSIVAWYVSPYIDSSFSLVPKVNHMTVLTPASVSIAGWLTSLQHQKQGVAA